MLPRRHTTPRRITIQPLKHVSPIIQPLHIIPEHVRFLPQQFVERLDEDEHRVVHERRLGRDTFAARALRGGWIQPPPVLQEALHVFFGGVDDAEAGDVDGAVFDHFAFPSVVHYLKTGK